MDEIVHSTNKFFLFDLNENILAFTYLKLILYIIFCKKTPKGAKA